MDKFTCRSNLQLRTPDLHTRLKSSHIRGQVTISTALTTAPGTYPITIQATTGNITKTTNYSITVLQ